MSTPLSEVLSSEADAKIIEPVEEVIEPVEETVEESAAPTAETEEVKPDEVEQLRAEVNAFKTQALDERGKRQALQQQMQALQAPVEVPDAYVEPDKAIQFGTDQVMMQMESRILNMSESQARGRHNDFDAMKDTFFNEMVAKNPALEQQASQQADPYEFVYQQAKNFVDFKDVTSMDDLRAKIEAETEAKYAAKYAEQQNAATEQAITNAIPGSLATATAAAANTTQATYSGPTPLNKIIGQ